MENIKIKRLTRTAILLALAIVFQLLGRFLGPNNNFIVGPLVNAVLIVATAAAGLWGGTVIAVIAPFVSALTNKAAIAPIILSFSPFIAAGNFILVFCCYLLMKKNKAIGIGLGALLKFLFLYGSINAFVSFAGIQPKIAASLLLLFSWPQLVTAVIGGILALAILKAMKRQLEF